MQELELVDRITSRLETRPGVAIGIGDDAAVLAGDPAIVATHDLLIEGVHFRRDTTRWTDLGHKALAVNLSDLAAMGADPVAALVGLGLPEDGSVDGDAVDALFDGMEALAARVGATVAGGDVSAAPALVLAVTALGRLPSGRAAVLRSGASPGDDLCVTGLLGGAAAGLAVLEEPTAVAGLDASAAEAAVRRHRRPEPRLAEGGLLAAAGATAMLDVSDGTGLDALRIARASGVTVEIELDRLPVHPSAEAVAEAADRAATGLALAGGEDYELLVTLPPRAAQGVAPTLPAGLTRIGSIAAGPAGVRLTDNGVTVAADELGYAHHV